MTNIWLFFCDQIFVCTKIIFTINYKNIDTGVNTGVDTGEIKNSSNLLFLVWKYQFNKIVIFYSQ